VIKAHLQVLEHLLCRGIGQTQRRRYGEQRAHRTKGVQFFSWFCPRLPLFVSL